MYAWMLVIAGGQEVERNQTGMCPEIIVSHLAEYLGQPYQAEG